MKGMDEMDRSIKLRSESLGYKVSIMCLSIWTLYESWQGLSKGGAPNLLPMMICMVSLCVQSFSEMIMKRKMIVGDEEYKEPNKILRTIIIIAVIAAAMLSIGSYLILILP